MMFQVIQLSTEMRKFFVLAALVATASGCTTAPSKPLPPAGLMPLISVIVPDRAQGACVYRLAATLGNTNAFGAFLVNNFAVMVPNSQQQVAYKLYLADVAWRLHFGGVEVNTNRIAVSRADYLYPSMTGLTNDWSLDLREFEASDPPGCIRLSTTTLDLDQTIGEIPVRTFRKAAASDWPAIYTNRYRDFVRFFIARP